MKKRNIPIILGIFLLTAGTFFALALAWSHKKVESPADLINISELSEEFMDNYFEGMKQISANYDSENILIVVSLDNITETFGAQTIIKAPNNTYILGYESKTDKIAAKKELENISHIYSITENQKYTLTNYDNNIAYNSWGIERTGLNHTINLINEKGGENVTAAIIDTGCDMDLFNKYFPGKIEETYNLYDVDTYGHETMFDNYGHGTHIAGTIAEGTPNNVKILPVKTTDGDDLTTIDFIAAINYIAYNHKADVINMSFSLDDIDTTIDYHTNPAYLAIEAANEENIISIVAAGNESTINVKYPAGFDNTISIAAVDSTLEQAEFSNTGDTITFSAPGVNIKSIMGSNTVISQAYSTMRGDDGDNDHETLDGTSMAAPHAVSAVATLKSLDKTLPLNDIIEILKDHSTDLGPKGKDSIFGYGFIDLSDVELCEDPSAQSCDEHSIFKKKSLSDIAIEEVILTPYNYGSVTNILATRVRINGDDDSFWIKRLDELDGVTISGYDPYANSEQLITINYKGCETSFAITNPNNYESGWQYAQDIINEQNVSIISGYNDNDLQIKKLYFPNYTDENQPIYAVNAHTFDGSSDKIFYQEIYLPNNIRKLGDQIFMNFNNMYQLKSDAEDLEVSDSTFKNLRYLTIIDANILFGSNSKEAFRDDQLLEAIHLSPNNTYIPSVSFLNCYNLKKITLPDNITTIKSSAFFSSGLESIVLSNNIQKIEGDAFSNTKIQSVFIPASVTSLAPGSFNGTRLNSITVSDENPIYDSRNNCNAVIESNTDTLIIGTNQTIIPDTVKTIGANSFKRSGLSTITIPEGVESIKRYAFGENSKLSKVVIPRSVTSIEPNNFGAGLTGDLIFGGTKLYIYDQSYAHSYALNTNLAYVLLDETSSAPDIEYIKPISSKSKYSPYEQVDPNTIAIEIKYYDIDEPEIISDFSQIIYPQANRNSFRSGDMFFRVVYDTANGYHNLRNIFQVNVSSDLDIEDGTSDKIVTFDGLPHTINAHIDTKSDYNIEIKYMDTNGNYVLEQPPEYTEIGEYTIDYKVYLNGEDVEYYGEHILIITSEDIISFDEDITIDDNIIVVNKNDNFDNIINKIHTYSNKGTFEHLDKNSTIQESQSFRTGDTLKIKVYDYEQNYSIAVLGDTDGDGAIADADYLSIKNDIMDIEKLSGVYKKAADMNGNNKIDIIDYIRVKKIIMGGNL